MPTPDNVIIFFFNLTHAFPLFFLATVLSSSFVAHAWLLSDGPVLYSGAKLTAILPPLHHRPPTPPPTTTTTPTPPPSPSSIYLIWQHLRHHHNHNNNNQKRRDKKGPRTRSMAYAAAPGAAGAVQALGTAGRRLCDHAVRAVQPPTKATALRLLRHVRGYHPPRVDR